MSNMQLTGDANVPAMPMNDAEVNHLRRLLAWMRCEYTLDEDMQRGFLNGAMLAVQHDQQLTELASSALQTKAKEIARVPIYVRQAVKMLTKALRDHERASGVVEA